MPELPEVETSRRGIQPHIDKQTITDIIVRDKRLRWPVPDSLSNAVNQTILDVDRRGKYILIKVKTGHIIIHLGMSGSLRICSPDTPAEKHDHIDMVFANNKCLRLKDPRRFGCVLWTQDNVFEHKLLAKLGPEPLSPEFNVDYLYQISRGKKCSIKSFIMNSHIVVGVGNIYACESLFISGINPKSVAGKISRQRFSALVDAIKTILKSAIQQGGTTLRDFTSESGKPGYFAQQLNVYGRTGNPCVTCSKPISQITQQNRSTFYCTSCQR